VSEPRSVVGHHVTEKLLERILEIHDENFRLSEFGSIQIRLGQFLLDVVHLAYGCVQNDIPDDNRRERTVRYTSRPRIYRRRTSAATFPALFNRK
jgi:hypothetical protein